MPTIGILWQHMFGKFWQQMCSFGNNKFIFGSKCQFCAKPLKPPKNHGKPWKTTKKHEQPQKNMENHQKLVALVCSSWTLAADPSCGYIAC